MGGERCESERCTGFAKKTYLISNHDVVDADTILSADLEKKAARCLLLNDSMLPGDELVLKQDLAG